MQKYNIADYRVQIQEFRYYITEKKHILFTFFHKQIRNI